MFFLASRHVSEEKSQALTETLRAKGVPRATIGSSGCGSSGLFLAVTALAEVGALHRGWPSAQAPTHLGNEKHVVCSHGMSWSQVFGVELKHCDILWPSFPVERELSKQSLGQQRWWDVGFKLGWVPSDDPNRLLAKIWSTQKTKRSLWSLWSLCVCNL